MMEALPLSQPCFSQSTSLLGLQATDPAWEKVEMFKAPDEVDPVSAQWCVHKIGDFKSHQAIPMCIEACKFKLKYSEAKMAKGSIFCILKFSRCWSELKSLS